MRISFLSAAALAAGLGFTPRAAAAPQRSAPPDAERLYRRYCASCHGDDFTGGDWRELKPEIPDFTSASWHAKRSDARLLASVLDGAGSGMPSFRGRLSEDQARTLVARLRRAAPGFVPAGRSGAEPDEFDRRFEELEEELDRLKKEFHEAADGPKRPDK